MITPLVYEMREDRFVWQTAFGLLVGGFCHINTGTSGIGVLVKLPAFITVALCV